MDVGAAVRADRSNVLFVASGTGVRINNNNAQLDKAALQPGVPVQK